LDHLSNIELYFADPDQISGDKLFLSGDEFQHAVKVMRHSSDDLIYVTDGQGNFFTGKIIELKKNQLEASIIGREKFENNFENIFFVIPKLKNQDRFEFALEKCVECGITNLIIFNAERSISKVTKINRWEKICLSAMKQSIRFFLPQINMIDSINEIADINETKFVFEQNVDKKFSQLLINRENKYYFIFGPEGGLTENELNILGRNNLYNLSDHRLRTETAMVKCAGIVSDLL
jgi:16S rRNA (uracil1498-N3)-methyltransferase